MRTFDSAVEELLDPDKLDEGRARPTETNSYLVQGEYGRTLQIYGARFPDERIHIESSADLGRDPGVVIDRILTALGLPSGYRPDGLDIHHHCGGIHPRVDAEGEQKLRNFMQERIWPRLGGDAEAAERSFDFFLQTWNVVADDTLPVLSASNRRRLENHYRIDGSLLANLGFDAPWLKLW